MARKPEGPLRYGWTTGAVATAAAKAALTGLLEEAWPQDVTITLPKGDSPTFPLVDFEKTDRGAKSTVIKDAGDDPDVTHGAYITSEVVLGAPGSGFIFKAGEGVGTVTRPGLPIPPGEPAINPGPRAYMQANLEPLLAAHGKLPDLEITVSIRNGAEIALKTWNPRLGIVGGLSVLGTTGVVVPFSCAAWIHSIHRGIDVAVATKRHHVAGATGKQSEAAVMAEYGLPEEAMLDMGDFAGGLLKYLRKNPVPRLTLAGGFAKILKLSQGHLDLHSSRSQVDFQKLSDLVRHLGGTQTQIDAVIEANTANQVLTDIAPDLPLAHAVARQARSVALATLAGETSVDILMVNRKGEVIAIEGVS